MRMPFHSTQICAEPRMWPAGWKVTATPLMLERFAVRRRLRRARKAFATAQPHDIERFRGRQYGAVTRARVIGMPVRDQRALDRPHRVDVESAGRAAQARAVSAAAGLRDASQIDMKRSAKCTLLSSRPSA